MKQRCLILAFVACSMLPISVVAMDIWGTGEVPTTTGQTDNLKAYDLYLEGRQLIRRRGEASVTRSLTLFEQATGLTSGGFDDDND